jgi:uncharacterized membrane protein YccF (DUF307 family)
MSAIGNILWITFGGGFFIFFFYMFGGFFLSLTIIGIPFAVQLFKLSLLGLVPFGRQVKEIRYPPGIVPIIMNILWILTGGIFVSLIHIIFAILNAITIIGIPFAVQHMKMAHLGLVPFGKTIQ